MLTRARCTLFHCMMCRHAFNERRCYATLQARGLVSTCWLSRATLMSSKKPERAEPSPEQPPPHSLLYHLDHHARTIPETSYDRSHRRILDYKPLARDISPQHHNRNATVHRTPHRPRRQPPPGPTSTAHTAFAQPWQSNSMALISENHTSSSSNYRRSSSAESSGRRSVTTNTTTASAYVVNAASMGLTGFHYSTCGAGGMYTLPQELFCSRIGH